MISIPSHLNVSSQDGGGPLPAVMRYLRAPAGIFIAVVRTSYRGQRFPLARTGPYEGHGAELELGRAGFHRRAFSSRIKGFAEPMRGFCVGFSGVGGGLSCVAVHGQQHAEKDSGNARFSVGEIRNVQR